ncbi:MAG: PAS domain-containing protein [Deltaproteobacteria bacterium]|nr:PAS domain-containing protein [Deltaproteobacteria bacterium]
MKDEEKSRMGPDIEAKQDNTKSSMNLHQMEIQRILSIALSSTDDLLEGLYLCLDASIQIASMDCGAIFLFDKGKENLNLVVQTGLSKDLVRKLATIDKDADTVLLVKRGEPIYTLVEKLPMPLTQNQKEKRLKAFAAMPLFSKSKVIGCIAISSWTRNEIPIPSRIPFETIAAQAGSVISRLQVQNDLKESEEHLKSLMLNAEQYAIYRLVASNKNLNVVFVSPSITDIMGISNPNDFNAWFENIHTDDRGRIEKRNKEAFRTFRFDEVMRINHPEKKEIRWIHAISKGMASEDGGKLYVNGIITDITTSKLAKEALVSKEKQLLSKTKKLKEINTALNVLLEKREADKEIMQEQVISNVKKLIFPYIEKLKASRLNENQKTYLEVIDSSLREIISPFSLKLSSVHLGLTPSEIEVADLIKRGKSSKEIAKMRNLSPKTVAHQRESIRKKLGLKNKKSNLQSYLNSLSSSP